MLPAPEPDELSRLRIALAFGDRFSLFTTTYPDLFGTIYDLRHLVTRFRTIYTVTQRERNTLSLLLAPCIRVRRDSGMTSLNAALPLLLILFWL